MKERIVFKYLAIIACCCLVACSQDPSSNENFIGEVSGNISFDNRMSHISDFEVRAYAYRSQQWHTTPVNSVPVSSDGSYTMKLPKGDYIFSLFNTQQNGPEFYYEFQHQFPCKTYELRLQDHYSDVLFANEFFYCEPEPKFVPENGALPGINFDIHDTGKISGQISQAGGNAFTQVTIKAFACKTNHNQSTIQTLGKYDMSLSAQARPDADGHYTICCLPKGDYLIKVETDQPEYITFFYDNVYFKDQAKIITIDSGNDWNINLMVSLGTTITGQIKSEDTPNSPIKDVLVSAVMTSTNYVIGKPFPSDANGNYIIYGLPKQHYILHANAEQTNYQSCYYNTKYHINDADAFEIVNTTPLNMNFDLQKQGQLVATIVDKETNTDIKNNQIYVKIYKSSDLNLVKTIQSNNGVIIADLDEGNYKAEVITNGTPYASIYYSNENALHHADDIPIFNGKVNDTVKFKLQRGGSIRGHVIGLNCNDPDHSEDLHNYTVIAYSKSNPSRTYQDTTGIFGVYQIDGMAEGNDYIVKVQTDHSSYIPEYYKQTYFQDSATVIDVDYDNITSNINFDLECGRQIYGKITNDTDNSPISGITVKATHLTKNIVLSATTDNNGLYVITGIPSGYEYSVPSAYEYVISADTSDQSFVSADYENVIQFEQTEKQVEVNFSLKKMSKICGNVTCPSRHHFDYCFENIRPGIYDLILIDEKNEEITKYDVIDLSPNLELENFDFDL
jgi:hypothetical protein